MAREGQHRIATTLRQGQRTRVMSNLRRLRTDAHAHLKLIRLLPIQDKARYRLRQRRTERSDLLFSARTLSRGIDQEEHGESLRLATPHFPRRTLNERRALPIGRMENAPHTQRMTEIASRSRAIIEHQFPGKIRRVRTEDQRGVKAA